MSKDSFAKGDAQDTPQRLVVRGRLANAPVYIVSVAADVAEAKQKYFLCSYSPVGSGAVKYNWTIHRKAK